MSNLNKPLKILIGIATIWPIIYLPIFFIFFFKLFILGTSGNDTFPQEFFIILPFHFLTIFVSMILYLVFVLDLINTDRVEKDKKTLWGLLIIFLGTIAMPIYWYKFVWRTPICSNSPKK